MRKAHRNRPLTENQTERNRYLSKTRYVVEQSFGTLHRKFRYARAAYFGLLKRNFAKVSNGEKAFGKVYEAINNAQNSVEIVCWGFQPSMYFIRGKQEKNIGELLLQKEEEGETGNMTLHRIFCVIWVWK